MSGFWCTSTLKTFFKCAFNCVTCYFFDQLIWYKFADCQSFEICEPQIKLCSYLLIILKSASKNPTLRELWQNQREQTEDSVYQMHISRFKHNLQKWMSRTNFSSEKDFFFHFNKMNHESRRKPGISVFPTKLQTSYYCSSLKGSRNFFKMKEDELSAEKVELAC